MKELRLVCRLSNNRLHRARVEMGLTVSELCRRVGISLHSYYQLASLRLGPRGKGGEVRDIACRLANFLGMSVDELFPSSLGLVKRNIAEREIDVADAMRLLGSGEDEPDDLPLLPMEAEVGRRELGGALHGLLETLSTKEAAVLRMRFGLDDGGGQTLDEVGEKFGVQKERIRQIEAKALRKLRHPSRTPALEQFLDDRSLDKVRKDEAR